MAGAQLRPDPAALKTCRVEESLSLAMGFQGLTLARLLR